MKTLYRVEYYIKKDDQVTGFNQILATSREAALAIQEDIKTKSNTLINIEGLSFNLSFDVVEEITEVNAFDTVEEMYKNM